MDSTPFKPEFSALGIDNLATVLDEIIKKAQQDAEFAKHMHDILFQFNQSNDSSKALIEIDASKQPAKCYYAELEGRPLTNTIRKIFIERQLSVADFHKLNIQNKINASITGEVYSQPLTLEDIRAALMTAIKNNAWDKLPADLVSVLKKFGTFKEEPKAAEQQVQSANQITHKSK